jgi:hypothetical protein
MPLGSCGDGGVLTPMEIKNLLHNQKEKLKALNPEFDPAQYAFLHGFICGLECVLNE